jgi:2-keto-4-pentenoate hydratase
MTDATVNARPGAVAHGDAVAIAAARLLSATQTGVPVAPVRDLIGSDDVRAAYAVQERVTQARLATGATVVGRKIGLTSPAVQAQLGVDQPDFGVLFSDMAYDGGEHVPFDAVLQPRAEAEVAFVLGADLVEGDLSYDRVRAAIAYAVAAIEICGSRVQGWDITFGDTVADNASAGAYVLGPRRMDLTEFEPREVTMTMTIDGAEVSAGTGAACLGDPVNAVVWLAERARELGQPLRSGQLVLSGALGPMRPIAAGNEVRAVVEPLGAVQFTVSKES